MRNINADLTDYTGTFSYHQSFPFPFHYTDGVNAAATQNGIYWFIDQTFLFIIRRKLSVDDFYVFKLEANEEYATFVCEDGNGNLINAHNIIDTDFENATVTFWFYNGVLMLPSEY